METKKKSSHIPERYALRLRFLAGLLLAMLFFTGCSTDDDEPSNNQQDSSISTHSEELQVSSEAAADEAESKAIVTPLASPADWNLVLVNRENQLAEEIPMEFYLTESGHFRSDKTPLGFLQQVDFLDSPIPDSNQLVKLVVSRSLWTRLRQLQLRKRLVILRNGCLLMNPADCLTVRRHRLSIL